MGRIQRVVFLMALLVVAACSHQELKAPCEPMATANNPGFSKGCDPKPINVVMRTGE